MPPGVLDIVKPFMDYYEVGPGGNYNNYYNSTYDLLAAH